VVGGKMIRKWGGGTGGEEGVFGKKRLSKVRKKLASRMNFKAKKSVRKIFLKI